MPKEPGDCVRLEELPFESALALGGGDRRLCGPLYPLVELITGEGGQWAMRYCRESFGAACRALLASPAPARCDTSELDGRALLLER